MKNIADAAKVSAIFLCAPKGKLPGGSKHSRGKLNIFRYLLVYLRTCTGVSARTREKNRTHKTIN